MHTHKTRAWQTHAVLLLQLDPTRLGFSFSTPQRCVLAATSCKGPVCLCAGSKAKGLPACALGLAHLCHVGSDTSCGSKRSSSMRVGQSAAASMASTLITCRAQADVCVRAWGRAAASSDSGCAWHMHAPAVCCLRGRAAAGSRAQWWGRHMHKAFWLLAECVCVLYTPLLSAMLTLRGLLDPTAKS